MDDARTLVADLEKGSERQCAQGVIANRDNRIETSLRLLKRCWSDPDLRPVVGILAAETLIDGYGKRFDYAAQARVGTDVIRRYGADMTSERRQGIQSDQAMAAALARAGTRPQTMNGKGPAQLKTVTNAMGTIEAQLEGNGVAASWMIDTGANYSVVTESLATQMGVVPLEAAVDVNDSREKTSSLKLGVVKTLRIGALTFQNVVALIVPDAVFQVEIKGKVHRIAAVLGHPVLSALGRVTLNATGSITAHPNAALLTDGGRMYMRMLTPVVETTTVGRTAPFGLDTGANVTTLFSSFARALPGGIEALRKEDRRTVGVSSSGTAAEAILPELRLVIGRDVVTIGKVSVDPEHGKADPRFGNVGLDLLRIRSVLTIDYRSMRFKAGPSQ